MWDSVDPSQDWLESCLPKVPSLPPSLPPIPHCGLCRLCGTMPFSEARTPPWTTRPSGELVYKPWTTHYIPTHTPQSGPGLHPGWELYGYWTEVCRNV